MAPGIAVNPRGLLSAHLGDIMTGMFLILVGLMADRVRLSQRASGVCVGLLLYGTYGNWITSTIAAVWERAKRHRLRVPGITPPRLSSNSF
jgi:hypothetical protein